MESLENWSEGVQTVYLSKLQLGSAKLDVCGRRNSSISAIWWAISAINGLMLLLHLNHSLNSIALCGFHIYWHHSRMPEKKLVILFWGPPKKAGRDPKMEKTLDFSWFGALPPMLQGWQNWEPFESEYFMIYDAFFGILESFLVWHHMGHRVWRHMGHRVPMTSYGTQGTYDVIWDIGYLWRHMGHRVPMMSYGT